MEYLKRKNAWQLGSCTCVVILGMALATAIQGCEDDDEQCDGCADTNTDSETDTGSDTGPWTISYSVVIDNSWNNNEVFGIRYNDDTGADIWVSDAPVTPWSHEFNIADRNFPLSFWAQSMPCDGTCEDYESTMTLHLDINGQRYATQEAFSKTGIVELQISGNLSDYLNNGPI